MVSAQCSLLTVSECQPDLDEVILTVPLPSYEGAAQLCQELCGVQEDCEYWSFNADTLDCSLLAYCYLHSCDNITAGPSPDFTECLCQNSGSCDDIVQENCRLLGTVLWRGDEVRSAHQCQEYLQLLGPGLGGEVFSYSHTDLVCYILDSGAWDTCSSVSGPRQPSVEQCLATSTTSSTETSTTRNML